MHQKFSASTHRFFLLPPLWPFDHWSIVPRVWSGQWVWLLQQNDHVKQWINFVLANIFSARPMESWLFKLCVLHFNSVASVVALFLLMFQPSVLFLLIWLNGLFWDSLNIQQDWKKFPPVGQILQFFFDLPFVMKEIAGIIENRHGWGPVQSGPLVAK